MAIVSLHTSMRRPRVRGTGRAGVGQGRDGVPARIRGGVIPRGRGTAAGTLIPTRGNDPWTHGDRNGAHGPRSRPPARLPSPPPPPRRGEIVKEENNNENIVPQQETVPRRRRREKGNTTNVTNNRTISTAAAEAAIDAAAASPWAPVVGDKLPPSLPPYAPIPPLPHRHPDGNGAPPPKKRHRSSINEAAAEYGVGIGVDQGVELRRRNRSRSIRTINRIRRRRPS